MTDPRILVLLLLDRLYGACEELRSIGSGLEDRKAAVLADRLELVVDQIFDHFDDWTGTL